MRRLQPLTLSLALALRGSADLRRFSRSYELRHLTFVLFPHRYNLNAAVLTAFGITICDK